MKQVTVIVSTDPFDKIYRAEALVKATRYTWFQNMQELQNEGISPFVDVIVLDGIDFLDGNQLQRLKHLLINDKVLVNQRHVEIPNMIILFPGTRLVLPEILETRADRIIDLNAIKAIKDHA